MRRFHEPGEFTGRNEGDIASPFAADYHDLLLIDDVIQDASEILTQVGVCRIDGRTASYLECTGLLCGPEFLEALAGAGNGVRGRVRVGTLSGKPCCD